LTADFDDVHIREEPLLRRYFEILHKRFAYEALPHKLAFHMQTSAIAFPYKRH
jgi:hypothetical protein